jgi:hypothetical protein
LPDAALVFEVWKSVVLRPARRSAFDEGGSLDVGAWCFYPRTIHRFAFISNLGRLPGETTATGTRNASAV